MKETNNQSNLLINCTEIFLQDNVIIKTEYDSLCKVFTKYVDENNTTLFYEYEDKDTIKLF